MSDLAPFVAATITDKVVNDLMKEVDSLKLQLSKTQEIEVTGSNGTPVYATGMLGQGEYTDDGRRWRVDLVEQAEVHPTALVDFYDGRCIEIRVGGSVWKSIHGLMTPASTLAMLLECLEEGNMSINFIDCRSNKNSGISFLWLSVGSIRLEEMHRNIDVDDDELQDSLDRLFGLEMTYPEIGFSFRELEFDAIKIKRTLENLGIKNMDSSIHNDDQCTCPICAMGGREHGEEFEDSDNYEFDDSNSSESDDSDFSESYEGLSFESDEGEDGSVHASTVCSTIPMWLEREKQKREESKETKK